jgi:hypothetical protein
VAKTWSLLQLLKVQVWEEKRQHEEQKQLEKAYADLLIPQTLWMTVSPDQIRMAFRHVVLEKHPDRTLAVDSTGVHMSTVCKAKQTALTILTQRQPAALK